MQIKQFQLSLCDEGQQLEEINKFLRSHRVLQVDRQFSADGGGYWSLLVSYQEQGATADVPPAQRGQRKDYRELLSEEAFARFARFREIRKELSQKQNVLPFIIFTDEELAKLAEIDNLTLSVMKGIKGIGSGRVDKYGGYFLPQPQTDEQHEAGGKPDGGDTPF